MTSIRVVFPEPVAPIIPRDSPRFTSSDISLRAGCESPVYENVTINNKGVYIQTTAGSDARAVYEGEVTTCMVMGSTYAIIVQHGNYRTVYTGIQTPSVKPGEKVKAKQNIGRIASNPDDDNKTELQFQVWEDRTLLNPELWLAQ